MFKKLLIANRGEIAVRIMQTAKRMGIATVAIYSEADANALHVKEADEAVFVGPASSSQSYLNMDAILDAISKTGAKAVHPGYGFLAENAEFARVLKKAKVTLVGPDVEAIRLMGDKIESKKIAKQAGVSTVPGTEEAVKTYEEAKQIVDEIGFPVIIKAAAGGGGKGIRVVRDETELKSGLESSASEAESSFSDGRVFIEKFFDNPRHIEVQILADKKGNVISLGERECSIQRRHQKVIEEAPSAFLSDHVRKQMCEQARALAKAVGYYSAGTVEFIVDQQGNFYFLEMNTRLQVEHRVTELITGIDLVEQMLRIADGEALPFTQEDIKFNGWAFEARVYAEDPKRGFLPSTGRITRYQEPVNEHKLLIDAGVFEGGEVSMYYDPMIAKICTHASTREKAIEAMQASLSAYIIKGVAHNIGFLEAIFSHPRFIGGDISTNFIEQEYPDGFDGVQLTQNATRVFLGVGMFLYLRDAERAGMISGQLPGRARSLGARWVVDVDGMQYPVYVKPKEYGYDVSYEDGQPVAVRSSWELGRRLFQGTVDGNTVSVRLKHLKEGYLLHHGGSEIRVRVRNPRVAELAKFMPPEKSGDAGNYLVAPIAGLIVRLLVDQDEEVKEGQELLVIEAMKMENVIRAEKDTRIKHLLVNESESVQADQMLIEFED